MNILNNSFSGRWVLNPRRYVDKLHSLINSLFGNGEQGAMYIPQPKVLGQQVLWQDAEGTVPVASDGDPVGLMLDLSGNGNHATQSTSAARPIYRTDGELHWLETDGVDDYMVTPATPGDTAELTITIAYQDLMGSSNAFGYLLHAAGGVSQLSSQGFSILRRNSSGSSILGTIGVTVGGNGPLFPRLDVPRVISASADKSSGSGVFGDNGVRSTSPVGTVNTSDVMTIGCRGTVSPTVFWKGSVYFLVGVHRTAQDNELRNLEVYAAAKSGVTL